MDLNIAVRRKIVSAVRHLSSDASALEPLETAGGIPVLVAVLGSAGEDEDQRQSAMAALYHLCKTNRIAQEQAAMSGIVPHLCSLIPRNPSQLDLLPALATPLLCAMVRAGRLRADRDDERREQKIMRF